MMTIAQARAIVGQQLGFPPSFDGSVAAYRDLSAADQIRLTQALFSYIRANPDKFTQAQQETVRVEQSRVDRMNPQETGFDGTLFMNELENGALRIGGAVANVGEGVVKSVNLVGTLLPIAILFVVFIYAYPLVKKATTPNP